MVLITMFPHNSKDETDIPRVKQPFQNIPIQEFQEVNRHGQKVPLGPQAHAWGGVGTLAERVHHQRAVQRRIARRHAPGIKWRQETSTWCPGSKVSVSFPAQIEHYFYAGTGFREDLTVELCFLAQSILSLPVSIHLSLFFRQRDGVLTGGDKIQTKKKKTWKTFCSDWCPKCTPTHRQQTKLLGDFTAPECFLGELNYSGFEQGSCSSVTHAYTDAYP